ncbi:glycosyl transferase possibly involved in lipopolysaccharide synthesis [Corynebacterium maris DSM 45190]|uniref:Glycosyl transferase possibly involved in lipopolysaccharide synthesis n=1 Tax=Corynebacterium maris DSM 45190 TaxID=1224163 RepID=S5T3V7_9CORY|nr:sugar transferase [Corynebacterium maris]AGS35330.1 glycosyl transferase possibly involved in lipopolysaccharide synthesis [Corynebacterium maris DSM 45190]
MKITRSTLKRALDVAVAVPALIVASPVMAATAVAVRLSLGGPVLFRQERPGLGGTPFTMLKFRSMLPEDPALADSDDETYRLTRVGKFIRATSIDELPTLWNVLRGDMSLVGPRPLLMQYLDRYTPQQARRHDARPGLTGLSQVSGRNALSWEERIDLDVEYVDNQSLALDLRILLRTVGVVLKREGVAEEGLGTMSEFWGTLAEQGTQAERAVTVEGVARG